MLGDLTPERWLEIKNVLDEVLPLACADRSGAVEEICAGDPDLRREVEYFLEFEPGDTGEDHRVGPYRVIRKLGEGGMGAVYLAERDDLPKRVAVKLLRRGFEGFVKIAERFHNEELILARLEHPHIAQLLDAGTTDDGLPYFAMEYVEGEPLDRYCTSRRLSVDERLELFLKVCAAVQLAHKNMVVHRDLKPGNILVTADAVPKLLDFGIARWLDADPTARLTTQGLGPMTLAYASPEQVRGQPVNTASDVYSLGVLLYELLTGLPPYRCPSNLLRGICEQDPPRPSTAVGKLAETDGFPDDPQRLRRRLAGDLDCIVLEAMHKDPEERYSSVEKLAEDIRRHLAGLPVEAREGHLAYRAGKFARRHKLALATAAAFVLLLGLSAVTAVVLWRQAERGKQRAEMASRFLGSLIQVAEPDQSKGRELTAVELFRSGKERILTELQAEPELQIDMSGTLGDVLRKLGDYDAAEELMRMSLAIARTHYGPVHSKLAKRLTNMAALLHDRGQMREAEALFREALEMRRTLRQEPRQMFRTKNGLATALLYRGEYEEAEKLYQEVLRQRQELYVPVYGHDDDDVTTSLRNLGALYYVWGAFDRAEPLLRDALERWRRKYGSEHTKVAITLDLLGSVHAARGDHEEAKELYRQALAIRRRLLGEEHAKTAVTRKNLAVLLTREDPLTAEELLTLARATLARAKPGGWELADTQSAWGGYLTTLGRYAEAEPILRKSYEALAEIRGGRAVYTRRALRRLEELYDAWDKPVKVASR